MIVGETVDHRLEGHDARGRDDACLPHPAAHA